MVRTPVHSSNIRSIGYDADGEVLQIEFHDGAVYEYYGVPPSVHESLMGARSHGSYLHRHVRNRYRYRQVQ